jgi:hypothetical protein
MKRIKSAPANIAEMVNRKKPNLEKPIIIIQNKPCQPPQPCQPCQPLITIKNKISQLKTQKNIGKTVNNIMLDYINDKQLLSTNDEEAVIISILYYYISEKVFTKKKITEFMLFIVQLFIKYIFTHMLHEIIMNNNDLITSNVALLLHKI